MNRYHVIAVLGFFLGIFTAATLLFAWLGNPLAVVSGSLGLITLWLVYSYIPEEGTSAEEWIPQPTDYEFDHVGKQPSSPAPVFQLALQGGQEPPGSSGAGETRCKACGGTGGFVDPLTNDAFLCPVCRPLKISPAPDVGGVTAIAEPTGDTGAGDLVGRQLFQGKHEGDVCHRHHPGYQPCKGVLLPHRRALRCL